MNLKDLRKIAESATPGPWTGGDRYFGTDKGDESELLGKAEPNDIKYIATFNPALVSKLLDVVEAAQRYRFKHSHSREYFDDMLKALKALEAEGERAASDEGAKHDK